MAYLLACARAAAGALEDLRSKRSNYFGAEFRDTSPLATLRNVERQVSRLAGALGGDDDGPREESAYAGRALGDDDAEALYPRGTTQTSFCIFFAPRRRAGMLLNVSAEFWRNFRSPGPRRAVGYRTGVN